MKTDLIRAVLRLLLLSTICLSTTALGQERILSFHSEISIETDGTVDVLETIHVLSEGRQIKTGIYREFPTIYQDRQGQSYQVGFQVVSVKRDGRTLPIELENRGNGQRIYMRERNVNIAPGEYTFELHYRTTRQLGFFAEHDELYWNVTGNGWAFQIDQASARVILPTAVDPSVLAMEGYTGRTGSRGQAYTASVAAGSGVISTTSALAPEAGLTLAFSFPRQIVNASVANQPQAAPQRSSRPVIRASNQRANQLAFLVLLATILYLFFMWHKYGRDPAPGVIFPHYQPPEGYSPASARYISKMGYDNLTFTSAVVNLAVKGYIKIDTEQSGVGAAISDFLHLENPGTYILRKLDSRQALAAGEAKLLTGLFSKSAEVKLEKGSHAILQKAMSAHKKSLKQDYREKYFVSNSWMLLPSILISVALLFITVSMNAFVPLAILIAVLILLMHLLFAFLLKAPSPQGRKFLDKLEGFKDYLQVAEKDELKLKYPPEKTPELFERFLPFAIALGVEQAWANRFTQVFASLEQQTGAAWHPLWYAGAFHYNSLGNFSKNLSSGFNSAIASAATPPGSASGAGGGGFSGGGGGGGGGGGC